MRSTAVVRAGCEPRSPRRHAYGGVTAGRAIRSTSTEAIRIADDHHTNDHPLSSTRLGAFATAPALGPARLDVLGDELACQRPVARDECVEDRAVLGRSPLERRLGRG